MLIIYKFCVFFPALFCYTIRMFNMLTKLVFVLLIIVGYCNRREKQETKEEQWWVERRGQGKRRWGLGVLLILVSVVDEGKGERSIIPF